MARDGLPGRGTRKGMTMSDNHDAIPILNGRRLLLGVCGSIAAYKAADLASKLTQAGAQVDVLLTEAATRFVSPLTFQSVTGRRAAPAAKTPGVLNIPMSVRKPP